MKRPFILAICAILLLLTQATLHSAVTVDPMETEPYPHTYHFITDPEPMQAEVAGNPLDYAGRRIGIDVRDFPLPRAEENYYRFACRFPIIDYVSNDPLYMKQWAEDTAELIEREHNTPDNLPVIALLNMLRGEPYTPPFYSGDIQPAIDEFRDSLEATNFTSEFKDALERLHNCYIIAHYFVLKARENLTIEDIQFFEANPGYFISPDGSTMASLTGNVESHFLFIEHARRFGYEYLFAGAKMLSNGIQSFAASTKTWTAEDILIDPTLSNLPVEFQSPAGKIIIGGFGNDVYETDAGLIIEPGGNDTYRNNAGGCSSIDDLVSVCIDISGDDKYDAPSRRYVQGFGFLGIGILADLHGNDRYTAGHFSQGAGIMGVGALWDCRGDDTYDAQTFCQGAGMFGLGALFDNAGDDFYDAASLCQGGATTLGMGVLSDMDGDDRYHLNVGDAKDTLGGLAGYGQGGALSFRHMPWKGNLTAYGGVGILVDAAGNDRYRSTGWCDQGGSYIMSLGALIDMAGNDHYTSGSGQGSGIHITNAILIDYGGDDIYEGGFRSGGSGGDRTPSFLIDYSGNDTYKSNKANYAAACKQLALALFIDYKGDDIYIAPNPQGPITMNNWDSFGGVWPESVPYLWPYAICLDLAGGDDYQVRNRRNNTERHSMGHGIHLDMEYKGGDIIGDVPNPLAPYSQFALPDFPVDVPILDDIKLLQSGDTFVRFQAIGRIIDYGPDAVTYLVLALHNSTHRQFNRDVMECIHYFLANGYGRDKTGTLISLLTAADEEVRAIIADDFGIWGLKKAEQPLIEAAVVDEYYQVRHYALRSLLALESQDGLAVARKLAIDDRSPDVRRIALLYISRIADYYDPYPIIVQAFKYDSDHTVRVTAIEAIGELGDERGRGILREAAESYDAYLQRAAGKGLANMYQVDGIDILIESLAFPSIDAFYNYDRNVPNDISAYAGYDLPEEERYDREKWREWFDANKDNIDIRANADAYRIFREIADAQYELPKEELIGKLEDFLDEHPGHSRTAKFLAATLNSVAWNMVTAAPGTPGYDPETGLKYAIRAVELVEDLNYVDTLAEAYFVNGWTSKSEEICLEMLEKYPGNSLFTNRLNRIKEVKGTTPSG